LLNKEDGICRLKDWDIIKIIKQQNHVEIMVPISISNSTTNGNTQKNTKKV